MKLIKLLLVSIGSILIIQNSFGYSHCNQSLTKEQHKNYVAIGELMDNALQRVCIDREKIQITPEQHMAFKEFPFMVASKVKRSDDKNVVMVFHAGEKDSLKCKFFNHDEVIKQPVLMQKCHNDYCLMAETEEVIVHKTHHHHKYTKIVTTTKE